MKKGGYDKAEAQRQSELRKQVVDKMLSVKGGLRYTQGERRDDIESGYADCSSLVRWAYKTVTDMDIGEDTAVQIVSYAGMDVDTAGCSGRWLWGGKKTAMPDVSRLEPGDLLFFTGSDEKRPFCVGHVEMYMGDGKIIGQNDRPYRGPTVKDMAAYIGEISCRGHKYIKTRRFINIC